MYYPGSLGPSINTSHFFDQSAIRSVDCMSYNVQLPHIACNRDMICSLYSVIWYKMSLNLSTRDSLLHGISFNKKGKIIWTKYFEDLQMFVEEVLDLTDGNWGCPRGFVKQFKSENIDL